MKLKVGDKVPSFKAEDEKGKGHSPLRYRGGWLLVYFYPRDNTPGCTKEACGVRDAWAKFKKNKIAVLGVSTQSAASHKKFIEKFSLPFPLLVDEEKKLVKLFGVWRKKRPARSTSRAKRSDVGGFMGREYMGTERMSFLIDPKGKITKIYERVKPAEHAEEILKDVEGFGA